jgi:hypothetical protein
MKKYYLITLTFILFSCENDSIEDISKNQTNTETTVDIDKEETPVSYKNDILPIMNSKCTNCHSKNAGIIPLTTYDEVKSTISLTIDRISRNEGESGFMPQGGNKLPNSTIELIKTWNKQGHGE